jgi:bifunctional DNase/RNase
MEDNYTKVFAQEILQGFTKDNMYILLLLEPVEMLQVPILIGEHEAEMIMLEHETQRPKRPMTHQLIVSLCETFHLELKKVTIDHYFEGVFYATLHISDGVSTHKIDSRVSDAIALALHEDIDIWINTTVLKETGGKMQFDSTHSSTPLPEDKPSLQELEQDLHRCEAAEDYEKAAEINKKIEALKKSQNN